MHKGSSSTEHIAIIGAGPIGLCAAHYLRAAGARVTVIDRTTVGGGAARGNGGLIATTTATPLPAPGVVSDALRHLFSPTSAFFVRPAALAGAAPFLVRVALHSSARRFRQTLACLDLLSKDTGYLWQQLTDAGIGTSLSDAGQLRCFDSEPSAVADHAAYSELARRGLGEPPGDVVGAAELRGAEPGIGRAVVAGYTVPGERFANPSEFVDEMHESLAERGVEFIENTEISDLGEHPDHSWVKLDNGRLAVDQVLIAAGARSGSLAARFGVRLGIRPGKGYSFSVPVAELPKRVLYFNDAHCAAIPLAGKARIAGTMEFDGTFDRLNQARVDALRTVAARHLDGADWTRMTDVWVGPRPMTVDGAPAIGALSARGRVSIATGHNMIGFALAPATGSLVADLMTGRASRRTAELEAFSPHRFRLRPRRRRAA
ncbi:FAD-dependent oxidoreductase [Amycolatopsis ultiminotia]|uniref:FAD-dependent oxidoreductase n=1 Tax=Amycolatopsis ultiminotia TaxID=543629 RepID=A0ABP6WI73_9PSEU